MAITIGSYGSSLDVESIVTALVDADVAPKKNALDRRESGLTSELTAVGTLKAALANLDDALSDLSDGSAFELVSIDAPDAVDILQTGNPSLGQYSIEVDSLAASQVLATQGFTASSTVVGSGTLSISVGTPTYANGATSGNYTGFTAASGKTATITLDSSNNTVSGIRDAVNAAKIGITASLVVDGSQTRLLFTADDTGAATAISITSSDAALAQLTHGYSSGAFSSSLTEARTPADASFKLNGLSLTNASNNITGLVDGLDFTLRKTTSSAESILIAQDTAGIEAKVQTFVNAYNDYQTTLSKLMDYKDEAGALAGDSTARRIQSAIRSQTTGVISLSGNSFSSLLDVGVTSDRDGKLLLSSSDFQSAVSSSQGDLREFFAGGTVTSGLTDDTDSTGMADLLKASIDIYVNSSTGLLVSRENAIDGAIEDIADNRLDIVTRMEALSERYTKQFTAMDTLVGQLQSTSDFLTNQMDAIKAAANR
ncbi:flagellar filament capping protein FliD [Luminiphilus sp.]|nr:flagellar filament capping protein FliD [Luminiphilus sp.]